MGALTGVPSDGTPPEEGLGAGAAAGTEVAGVGAVAEGLGP